MGQNVFVVGGCVQLGNWNPNACPKLVSNKLIYPRWESEQKIEFERGSKIEYKYLIKDGGAYVRWEDGENRVIQLNQAGETLIVTDGEFGCTAKPGRVGEETEIDAGP